MGDFAESAARVAVLVLIVAPATTWLVKHMKAERASRAMKRFTVDAPITLRKVCIGGALVFEALMLVAYVANGVRFGEWQGDLMWLGHAFAIIFLAIWGIATLQKLEVDGSTLRYRSIFGRTKHATFADITRVAVNSQLQSMTLYARGRRFATFSLQNRCVSNLLKRLEGEGITVEDATRGPITIGKLYRAAVLVPFAIATVLGIVTTVVLLVLAAVGSVDRDTLALVPFAWVMLYACCMGIVSLLALRGIRIIKRQERMLDFSFKQEMAAHGATGTAFQDDAWFVDVSNCQIVAFRRDYLKKVGKHKSTSEGDECVATAFDGARHKIRAASSTLDNLRTWFNNGGQPKQS